MSFLSKFSILRGKGVSKKSQSEPIHYPPREPPKYGWGWFLLLGFISSGIGKLQFYESISTILLASLGWIPLLWFYFWYRAKLIKRNKFIPRPWLLSFQSGFLTYLLSLILIFAISFIGHLEKGATNKKFIANFQKKAIELKKEDQTLSQNLIHEPASEQDIEHNLNLTNKYLRLIEKKRKITFEFLSYCETVVKEKNDPAINTEFNRLNVLANDNFDIAERAMTFLRNYYETGDDKAFENFEKLSKESEKATNLYQLKLRHFIRLTD